jgi:hypothetical protein
MRSWRAVISLGVAAMTRASGRNRAIERAVPPVRVQAMMTGDPCSRDARQPAAVIVAVILAGVVVTHLLSKIGVRQRGSEQKFSVAFQRFTGVESLRRIKTPELIAEVEKVIEQDGLPADVFYGLSSHISEDKEPISQFSNIAATLLYEFHEFYPNPHDLQKPVKQELEKLWEESPIGEWNVDEQKLDNLYTILTKLEPKRQAIRSMLEDDRNTHFYYIFNRPESLKNRILAPGTTVNTEASKYLADYALLEEYAIAQALLDGNIGAAIGGLAYIFRIAQLASMLGNVGVRSDAALVRLRAFDVMQRVVLDPKFEKKHMIDLRAILTEQRDEWTPEYVTWFGDRASGMMLYHQIMAHGLDDALEPTEREVWEGRDSNALMRGFQKYHEADETFYLRAMQKIMDVSNKSYGKRSDVLNQINQELRERADTYDIEGKDRIAKEYFVANLLTKDVERLMQIFAQDQSALDRALVVILWSLGQSNTDNYRDPFTGDPYVVRKVQGLFSVSVENLPRPFRVPIFTDNE